MTHNEFPHRIDARQLLDMFDFHGDIPALFTDYYMRVDTAWRHPTPDEERTYTQNILKRMLQARKSQDREENHRAFNEGWRENLERVRQSGVSLDTLKPGYYRGVRYLLFGGKLLIPRNPQLNYDLAVLCALLIFSQYLRPYPTICEFGCGSGLNLYLLSLLFPDKKIIGLDWCQTAVELVQEIGRQYSANISGRQFDLLAPADFQVETGAAAFLTYTALEQVGERFKPFIDFIRAAKPALAIHWEPFTECYDENSFWDMLSHNYCASRGYLNGMQKEICGLSESGKAVILTDKCPGPGGEYYCPNLLVWRPL